MNKLIRMIGIFQQQDVAAGGTTYPAVITVFRSTAWSGNPTTHNMPLGTAGTIDSGDLLLACLALDGTAAVSCTGWTLLHQTNNSSGNGATLAKVAAGTEGGTTVNFTTASGESGGGHVYHIQGWGGTIATHVNFSAAAVSYAGSGFDAPSLTPSFGATAALWIAYSSTSLATNPTGVPANWTNPGGSGSTTTTGGIVMTGYRELNTASHSPGTFTHPSTSGTATMVTIAIKGP